jgi:hypothetical protein
MRHDLRQPGRYFGVIALALWSICIAPASSSDGSSNPEYVVAASKIRWQVDLGEVECLSLASNRALIFQKSYSDDPQVKLILEKTFPEKRIEAENPKCSHSFTFNILSGITRAVRYRGEPSVVSMAFQICKKDSYGNRDNKACSYKNLYLFRGDITPLDAFAVGLQAFVRGQESRWAIIRVRP